MFFVQFRSRWRIWTCDRNVLDLLLLFGMEAENRSKQRAHHKRIANNSDDHQGPPRETLSEHPNRDYMTPLARESLQVNGHILIIRLSGVIQFRRVENRFRRIPNLNIYR